MNLVRVSCSSLHNNLQQLPCVCDTRLSPQVTPVCARTATEMIGSRAHKEEVAVNRYEVMDMEGFTKRGDRWRAQVGVKGVR